MTDKSMTKNIALICLTIVLITSFVEGINGFLRSAILVIFGGIVGVEIEHIFGGGSDGTKKTAVGS